MELVYGVPAGALPGISEKRRNRLELRRRLLRDIWGEDEMNKPLNLKLDITGEARALMEERMILESDVIQVMSSYNDSGEAVLGERHGTAGYTATHRKCDVLGQIHRKWRHIYRTPRLQPPYDYRDEVNHA